MDRYNDLVDDYNLRCGGLRYRQVDGEEATESIDGARPLIVAAALEDAQRLNDEGLTRQIQKLLGTLGYAPGAVDGVYGAQTKAAIEAFQQTGRSKVDGLVSRELLDRLQFARTRRLMGREGSGTDDVEGAAPGIDAPTPDVEALTADVVVRVVESSQESASDISASQAVPDAEVTVSGEQGFQRNRLTNERGLAEFSAVPAGNLGVDVRANGHRSRVTFRVTEKSQEFWITVPPPTSPPRSVSKR